MNGETYVGEHVWGKGKTGWETDGDGQRRTETDGDGRRRTETDKSVTNGHNRTQIFSY